MATIKEIRGREILDSRGNPTVEVEITLENGIKAISAVPSGASTGSREAIELRDKDPNRYNGKGVLKAVENVNSVIADALKGKDPSEQKKIDDLMIELDGTPNKEKLGANAILGVSISVAKAAAQDKKTPLFLYLSAGKINPLPIPFFNILNGGAHADTNVDIQEFMIAPVGAPSFCEALRFGTETYHSLKSVLKSEKLNTGVGDEGGFAPELKTNEEALELIVRAIEKAGYRPGEDIALAMDAAASEFYEDGEYVLKADRKRLPAKGMVEYYRSILSKYPVISIEDALSEHDWEGWKLLTKELGNKVQLVGDDLFVTNSEILKKGIDEGIANSILIKLNQIGTVTETIKTVEMALEASYKCMFSHRSGETEDSFLADISVSAGTGQLKTGATARSERIAKYNQLLRIEEMLGSDAKYYKY
ncbi:phosphopyruvate hydratase [Chitinispirillales bacterium ANBcel5]|uniref:phosphopyruvate hydratase n=1 Tax=Cellulosispirillum alkaliphilum TaxID=3039283 RepID=UPI002A51D71E|nr:phosphopyruvate hydratase [Chitinispirillales bacterium ANBcel5]